MNSNHSCYIIGAGDFSDKYFNPSKHDIIICADGGFNNLDAKKYNVSYIIGDNDSINSLPNNIPTIIYNSEKDETDMDLAVRKAIDLGYKSIKLYGGYGDRPDHFIANIQLIARYAKAQINITLFSDTFMVVCLNKQKIQFKKTNENNVISIFSLDNISKGINISGLKYELNNATLKNTFSLGISNQTTGNPAAISIEEGTLLIISYDELANNNYQIINFNN